MKEKVCDTVIKRKYLENITDRNLHGSGSGQFTITEFGTCLGLVTTLSGLTFFLEDRAWSELTYFFRTKLGLISFRCQIFSLGFDQSCMILAWPGPFKNHINLVPPKNLCKKCIIGILTLLYSTIKNENLLFLKKIRFLCLLKCRWLKIC